MKNLILISVLLAIWSNPAQADHAIMLNCQENKVDPVAEIAVAGPTRNLWIAKNGSWLRWNKKVFKKTGTSQVGVGDAWEYGDLTSGDKRTFKFVPVDLALLFSFDGKHSGFWNCTPTVNPFMVHP
jgi:hypothetical protein